QPCALHTTRDSSARADRRATPFGPVAWSRNPKSPPRMPTRPASVHNAYEASFGVPAGCLVEHELSNQFLEHYRRLGLGDAAAVGEHLRVAAGIEADVHLAEQARRQDGRYRILAELIALVDLDVHQGLVGFRVEPDLLHPPDHHA